MEEAGREQAAHGALTLLSSRATSQVMSSRAERGGAARSREVSWTHPLALTRILALLLPLLLGSTPAHNTHIAHTRIVLEGPVVIARVRMFRDDLEKALKLKITESSAVQKAVGAYVGKNFGVSIDGTPLVPEVVDSGGDTDGDQAIWWVLVQWKAARPVTALGLKVHVLFDTFDDQQNIVVVNRQPGDDRRSLYFQPGDRTEQVVKF